MRRTLARIGAFLAFAVASPAAAASGRALTGGPDGTPWVVANDSDTFGNAFNFRLEHFSATGVFVSSTPLPGALDGNFGVAFDGAGNVWVSGGISTGTSSGLGIWKFNPSASAALGATSYVPPGGFQVQSGPLAVDAAGNVWVAAAEQTSASFTYKEELFELSPALALLSSSTYQRGGGLDGGLWTAVDASGGVWVAGVSSSPATGRLDLALWKYDLTNRLQPGFPVFWPDAFQSVNALDLAMGINGAPGRVWIAARKDFATCAAPDFALLAYDLSGVQVSSSLWHGSPDIGAVGKALSFDAAGNVWAIGRSSSATALWQFSPGGVLAAGYPQTGPYNTNAILLAGPNQAIVLSGDQPTPFASAGTLAGASGPGACAQAAAGPGHLSGTLTYPGGFAAGALVNLGVSSVTFLGGAQPAFFPFSAAAGTTLSYSVPVAAPSTYSVVAVIGSPNALTPGSVVGAYRDYAAVAAAAGSTTSAVDFQLFPDTTPPTSALTAPLSGSTLTALGALAGTAADDFGAGDLFLAAQDLATGQWWDAFGGLWITTTTAPLFQHASPVSSGRPDRLSWSQDVSSAAFNGQQNYGGFSGFLVNGRQYRLFVRARDFVGNVQSTAAPSVSFLWNGPTGATAPPPPPFVQGYALGISSINWSWGAVPQAKSYNVYAGTSALLASTTQASFVQAGLAPSAGQTLCVACVNAYGAGAQACSSAVYALPAVPGPAAFVSVTSTTIALSWPSSGNDPAAAYQAVLATAPDRNSVVQAQRVASATAAFASLFGSTTYYAAVAAINGAGQQSDYAPFVSTVTPAPAPGPVMNIAGSALGISSIAWTWSAAAYAASYQVLSGTVPLGATSTTTFFETGLATAAAASICVQGLNAAGAGPVNCGPPVRAAAAAPGALSFFNVSPQGFTVSWDTRGNDGTTAYEVSLSTDGFNVSVSTPGPFSAMMGNSFTLTGLTPGATYFARVRAQNADGLVTGFSPVGRQRTFLLGPNAPTLLSAQPDAAARLVRLSWQPAATGVPTASYLVYRGVSPDTSTFMVQASTTAAALSDLITGSATYYYQVAGVNADGVPGARSAALAAGIDVTPPQRVLDLRVTAQRSAQGQADLAWTAPADDFSGVSRYLLLQSASFMFDSPTSTTTIPALAPGATVTYTVSLATTQAVYLAVRSVDGQGNVSAASNAVLFDPVPPVVAAIGLSNGQVVSRPMNVNASASDNVAVARTVFLVDGSTAADVPQGFLSFFWDTRALVDGAHVVEVDAYDAAGNKGSASLSVTASYAPPSPPYIAAPAPGFGTRVATITVSGYSDPYVNVQLQVNNLDLATTSARSGSWSFSPAALPGEGDVSLTAIAYESRGFSAPSAAVKGVYAATAPNPPQLVNGAAAAGGASQISWSAPVGKVPTFYRVYRSTNDLLLTVGTKPNPSLLDGDRIAALSFTETPALDNLYFYGVTSVDGAGNESLLSDVVYVLTDRVPPTATVVFSTPQPVGLGVYNPRFALSKPLAQPPIVTFTPFGGSPVALNLTALTATLWTSTVTVTAAMGEAPARFAFQGTDLAGNVGTALSSATLLVDTVGPSAAAALSRPSPVSSGPLTVRLTLNEPSAAAPALTLTPQGLAAAPLSVVAASTDGTVWTAAVTITPTTGEGQARLDYRAADPVGNVGTLLSGTTVFVIDTVPPPAPAVVRANPLPGALIALSWSAGLGEPAAYYSVYRDGVKLSTRVYPAADGSGSYLDSPGQGQHRHQVSAVDLAGNESALTDPISIAKATPPSPPTSVTGALNASGQVQVAWQAASTDTVSFKIYRTTYTAASLAGLPGRSAASPFIDAPPADGSYHYVVTALDSVGNESAGSAEAVVLYPNGAPVVTVNGITDGAFYAASVMPTFTAQDLILDTTSVHAALDGAPFVSGSTVSAEGAHTLVVSAASTAGHTTTVTTRFTIDRTPPLISFSVANNALLTSTVPVSVQVTASDLNLATTAYTLVNALLGTSVPYDSGALISRNGQYALTALATDLAGNASSATLSFALELAPIAPLNLTVQIGGAAQLSWTKPEPDVAGYRVYKDGVRVSAALNVAPFFTDAAVTPGAHVYEVAAVDSAGVEGARARASVPAATLGFNAVTLTRGYFDALHPTVLNGGAAAMTVGPAYLTVADAAGNVAQATAPAVSAAAGASAQLEGVIATPVALGPATLHAVVALPTDPGAAVFLAGDFPVLTADPKAPLLEVLPGPLMPGTLSPVQARLYNRGSAPMDVVTAQVQNSTYAPVNDVQVLVQTPQGTVLGASGLQQTGNGANAAILPGGRQVFFVTIPPGQSQLFDAVQVAVPNTALTTLNVAAVVSTPTFSLPFNSVAGARNFTSSSAQATVSQVPYRATVRPDRQYYDQGSSVTLSGRTIDSISGFGVPNVTVAVHVVNGGFDRTVSAVTDSTGNYTTAFFPLPNEAGVYALSASHPAVIDRVPQSTFTIVGLAYQYTSYTATLAQNSTFTFTVDLANTGGSAVTGLAASSAALSGSGVTLTVAPGSLPATLPANAKATLSLSVAAAPLASSATLALTITESHGFTRTLPITATVMPAQVIPSVTPQQFQLGMLGGDSRVVSLVIANKGFDTWRGVTLTNPALSWVTIQGLTSLGDIPPGGNANVSLLFNPPSTLSNGTYSPAPLLQITSLNVAPVPVLPSIAITSSRQGDVQVSVINADKPRSSTGQGVPVAGAKVTLTSLDVAGLLFTVTADLNGLAQFAQIPSGNYAWRAEAQGFQTVSGTALMQPGLANKIEALLPTATVTYQWSVTPTTVQDKYNITLAMLFKTDVPAPALVIDPPMAQVDLDVGQSAYGQYTITNKGLVSAMNFALNPHGDDGLTVELPFTTIPEIKPGQSVVVPYKVTYVHHSAVCKQMTIEERCEYYCAAQSLLRAGVQTFTAVFGPQSICGGGPGTASKINGGFGSSPAYIATPASAPLVPPSSVGGGCHSQGPQPNNPQNPPCGGASPLDGSHFQPSNAGLVFPGLNPPSYSPSYSSFAPSSVNPGGSAPSGANNNAPGWGPPTQTLQVSPDGGTVTRINPDGSRQDLVPQGSLSQQSNGNGDLMAKPVALFDQFSLGVCDPTLGCGGSSSVGPTPPIKQTSPDGTVTTYNIYGSSTYLVTKVVDRNGNTLTYSRDNTGLLLRQTDGFGRWIAFTYNAQGQLTGASDSAGRSTSYSYNAQGDKASETDANGDVTSYSYDANHRMTSITYPNGGTMTLAYDAQGRVSTEQMDLGNNRQDYTYYASSTVVVDALGHSTEYDWTQVQGLRKYTRIVDPNGGVTKMTYDSNMNLASQTDPLGRVTTYAYDANGNVTSVVDAAFQTTQAAYDPAFSQPTSVIDAKGNRTAMTLDAKGNAVSVQDAAGNFTNFGYDAQGHVTAVKDALGDGSSFSYDARGAMTRAVDPLNRATAMSRDLLGRLTLNTDPAGKQTSFSYDAQGNLTQVKDALNGLTSYAYQPGRLNGKLLSSLTDAKNHATSFGYDALGRQTSVTNALNQSASTIYNKKGKPTSFTNKNGQTITLAYDSLDRLTQMGFPEGNVSYTYDAAGNLLTATKYNGTALAYAYDSLNRVTQEAQTLPNGYQVTLRSSYDAAGNRTSLGTPWGTFSYAYDALNRMTSVTNPYNQTVSFAYDAAGRVKSKTYPNGTQTTYAYDAAGQVTQIMHRRTRDNAMIAFDNYVYDVAGNRTQVTDQTGTHAFAYDDLHRLISASHPSASGLPILNETFGYDGVGNRTADAARTGYTYDAANRLVADSSFTYTYDADGNMTGRTSRATGQTIGFRYDSSDRLVEVDSSTSVIAAYKWDAVQRRVEKNVGGIITRYVYDGSRVLAVLDAGNNLIALFTNGPALGELLELHNAGGDFVMHADALGSESALTDATGNVVETASFEAYGQATIKDSGGGTHTQSTAGNPWNFAAIESDTETGLYHAGPRFFDPESGRWMQEDPIGMLGGDIDLYTYAELSPAMNTDPSGRLTIPGIGWVNAGENTGEDSAQWYADQYNQSTGLQAAGFYAGGLLSSLWTPCTSDKTAKTLAGALIGSRFDRLLGSNRYLRVGGRTFKGERELRISGKWVDWLTGEVGKHLKIKPWPF